jgi:hypothetical protein
LPQIGQGGVDFHFVKQFPLLAHCRPQHLPHSMRRQGPDADNSYRRRRAGERPRFCVRTVRTVRSPRFS